MAKVIIGIHGLGNKPPKEVIEEWWKKSIIEGLENIYKDNVPDFTFKMVYWADILYENPLDEKITDPNNPLYLGEPYVKGLNIIKHITRETRKSVIDFFEKYVKRLFLNKDLTLNFSYLVNAFIHRYFRDLESYYYEKESDEIGNDIFIKDVIRERLVQVLEDHKKDEIFLVAHSMGSIIAYDVLSLYSKELSVDKFITIGSPLGFPIVMGKIAAELKDKSFNINELTTPNSIKKNWFNFSDIDDNVALNYSLSDDFGKSSSGIEVFDYEVYNDYQVNDNKNPHKSFGYLRTNEFSKTVFDFLSDEKRILKTKFIFKIFKFLIELRVKKKKKKIN